MTIFTPPVGIMRKWIFDSIGSPIIEQIFNILVLLVGTPTKGESQFYRDTLQRQTNNKNEKKKHNFNFTNNFNNSNIIDLERVLKKHN